MHIPLVKLYLQQGPGVSDTHEKQIDASLTWNIYKTCWCRVGNGIESTHEPDKLSMNTLRTKSSIECSIRSRTLEQSGSVANWSSFPDISDRAAVSSIRRSKNPVISLANENTTRAYLHSDRYPHRSRADDRYFRLATL